MNKYSRLIVVLTLLIQPTHLFAVETFFSLERHSTPIRKTPTNVSTISAEDIEKMDAKTLADVIDKLPSVAVTRNGGIGTFTTFRMRGVPSSNQVRVFVDDQPMSGISADQNFDISQIPVESIDHIEVVRGGASVLYGANTIGGIVNIITKKAVGKTVEVGAGVEARGKDTYIGRVENSASNGVADAAIFLNQYQTQGFQQNADGTGSNGTANLGYSFPNGMRATIRASHNRQESGVPQGTAVPISEWNGHVEVPAGNTTKRNDKERFEARGGLDIPFGDLNQLSLSGYGSDSDLATTNSADPFEDDFTRTDHVFGSSARLNLKSGTGIGLDWERDEFVSSLVDSQHIANVGSYIQQEIGNDTFRVVPALRYDNHSTFGSQFNPRITAVANPSHAFSISGNIARSFRAPDFFDLYGDFPAFGFTANRDLKPEKAWTYDLGLSLHPNQQTEFSVTGFFTQITDRIQSINTDGDPFNETNANVSKSEIEGAEVQAFFQTGRLAHSANYTYTRSRATSATSTEFVPLASNPVHKANYIVDLHLPANIVLTNIVQYASKQFQQVNEAGLMSPGYTVWHARLEKKFSNASVYAGVNNLLNRRYANAFDFDTSFSPTLVPMDDRTFYGGASIKIGSVEQ